DGSGNASFTFHPSAMNVGAVITATATDVTLFDDDNNVNTPMVPHNDTSEFSPCVTAVAGTPGTLQFSASNYNDTELNSSTHTVTITVTRTGGSDGPASVHYATSDGTATASSDYDSTSGDFNWTDGDATDRTFTVTVHGDTTYEANETVKLTLSSVTGADLRKSRRDTGGDYRIFTVDSGKTVNISGLTITNGHVTSGGSNNFGGGVFNSGTLNLTECAIAGNSATGGNGNFGGGIWNEVGHKRTLLRSTIAGNSISGGTGNRHGGRIY